MMCALNMRGRNANSNSSANSNYNSLSFPLPSRTHPLTRSNSPQTNPNAPKPKTLAFKFHLPTFKTLTFDSNAWARIAILEPRRCCCPPLRIPRSVFSTLFVRFLVVFSNLKIHHLIRGLCFRLLERSVEALTGVTALGNGSRWKILTPLFTPWVISCFSQTTSFLGFQKFAFCSSKISAFHLCIVFF